MTNQYLKIDFHIHTREDTDNVIDYTAFDLIDRAASLDFDAISITNHDVQIYGNKLKSYAEKKDLILFPGMERSINHKHVLLINFSDRQLFNTYNEIQLAKTEENLVIAPHPFFPGMQSLGQDMYQHPELFDAVEFCHFYCPQFNFNREAIRFSKKYHLPLVAGSDAHVQEQFGRCYSLVKSEKNQFAIIQAIKAGDVQVVSSPLQLSQMIIIYLKILSQKPSLKRALMRVRGIGNRLRQVSEIRQYLK